jgi:hypothetical protein
MPVCPRSSVWFVGKPETVIQKRSSGNPLTDVLDTDF